MMNNKETRKIRFTKMHGAGNDYIYVNVMENAIADPVRAAIAWSDRHKGIGSDGLVLIDKSPVPEADYSMRIFNADGSEAMMCGNASRCIGKYLYERTHPWPFPVKEGNGYQETEIRLLTLSGVKTLYLHIKEGIVESVTVDMGEPKLEDETLFIPKRGLSEGTFVSMGNPHYVIFTNDIDQVGETGKKLELHPAFPQRCNIEFAAPLSSPLGGKTDRPATNQEEAFRVRVWERGSGITQACGTGACATAVAAVLTGKAGRKSQIIMDGGTLDIEWREADNHVYMTGPAEFVFDGETEDI
jgi:diaminopimelate epimerase